MGRKTVRMGRTKRTARLVSLSKSALYYNGNRLKLNTCAFVFTFVSASCISRGCLNSNSGSDRCAGVNDLTVLTVSRITFRFLLLCDGFHPF